jgi:hypothetical protein
MTHSRRRHSTKSSKSYKSSASSRDSDRSYESYNTYSTAPTASNPQPYAVRKDSRLTGTDAGPKFYPGSPCEDISPATSCCPRSSVETYDSRAPSELHLDQQDVDMDTYMDDYPEIPPLPIYRREVVDPNVRPSTPHDFSKLFPSMNRLSIRHDEFTPDGNMNLRVDTVVPGPRRGTMQLFHLRMYDLSKREFSLRRYCRDSGREVCNSKRKFVELAAPGLQRSVSSAFKSLGGSARQQFRRTQSTGSGGSLFSHGSSGKRPQSSYSSCDGDDEFAGYFDRSMTLDSYSSGGKAKGKTRTQRPEPSNTIKLEFSNYARVDVSRRGGKTSKRYEFEWWGHKYSWKRVTEKHLNVVSFHLMRDGCATPVAHIVPETRSPNQVSVDEHAGGWVPPCHMWISDKNLISAATDVAE